MMNRRHFATLLAWATGLGAIAWVNVLFDETATAISQDDDFDPAN